MSLTLLKRLLAPACLLPALVLTGCRSDGPPPSGNIVDRLFRRNAQTYDPYRQSSPQPDPMMAPPALEPAPRSQMLQPVPSTPTPLEAPTEALRGPRMFHQSSAQWQPESQSAVHSYQDRVARRFSAAFE